MVFKNTDFAVIDDVFPPHVFKTFWPFFRRQQFRHLHGNIVEATWKPRDGNPLQGYMSVLSGKKVPEASSRVQAYPTQTILDLVIDAVVAHAKRAAPIVGKFGSGWRGVLLSMFAYPSGTSLSWHSDEEKPTYIYYVHPRWGAHWGGELMLMPKCQPLPPSKMFDDADNDEKLSAIGMGTFIAPKPNRLILVARRIPHMIAPVSASAGDNVRASITGCFLK